jgi:hypothetical protein
MFWRDLAGPAAVEACNIFAGLKPSPCPGWQMVRWDAGSADFALTPNLIVQEMSGNR